MKKLCFLLLISYAVYILPGCRATRDAKGIADSLNKSKEKTTADGGIAVNLHDAKFTTAAAVEGMYAMGLAKMALIKTSNKKIQKFAQTLVTDYERSNGQLVNIAKAKKITLPYTLDTKHQGKMDALSGLSGDNFDKVYIARMINDQKEAINLMQKESTNGADADLKAFAAKTASINQLHLDAARKIHDSI